MAIRKAVKTGNWSDPTLLDGAVVDGDIVYSNGFNITFDVVVSLPLTTFSSSSASGVSSGGSFIFLALYTVSADRFVSGSQDCFVIADGCVINADFYGGGSRGGRASGGQNIVFNGNFYGGSASGTGTASASPYMQNSTGLLVINGDCIGGTAGAGMVSTSAGAVIINGNVVAAGGPGVRNESSGTITVSGNATSNATAAGGLNQSTGTLAVAGESITGDGATIGGVFGTLSTGLTTAGSLRSNNLGLLNVGYAKLADSTGHIFYRIADTTLVDFVDSASLGDPPAESDVRDEVTYNFGNLTGTLAVADPAYVSLGVPTDDTVGTLTPALDAAALRTALGMAAANLDDQLNAIGATAVSVNNKLTTERLTKIDGAMQAAGEGFTGETLSGQITAIDVGGGDATEAKQDLILTKLNSARVSVVSNVSRGGTITIYLGDDDVGGNAILLPVDDEGEALKDLLQAESIAEVLFGAGTGDNYNEVTGTIDPDAITAADGITTIPIEILSTDKLGPASDDYEYHIKTVADETGYEKVILEGCLLLRPERRKVTT